MCNCGKKLKLVGKPTGHVSETKAILKKIWETSKLQEKPISVIKINKT